MNWKALSTLGQLDRIDGLSKERPVLIFKHSTRCAISKAVLHRLERAWSAADDAEHTVYFLDLLAHRDISDAVAARYGIQHESPQVLVIRNEACTFSTSHTAITCKGVLQAMGA